MTEQDSPHAASRGRRVDLAGWGLILGSFVALASQARGVILDPLIDIGRDLYLPEQIAGGARLYRDFRYNYPPLIPYLSGALVRLFGSSLSLYLAFNLAVGLATCIALYLATRRFGAIAASMATLLFVTLCLSGVSSWNSSFLVPYAQAATVGALCTVAFGAAITRALQDDHFGPSHLLWISFGTLASWSKHEYALAVVAAVVVTAVAQKRMRWPAMLFFVLNGLLFGAASLFFSDPRPGHHWIRDNILSASLTSSPSAALFGRQVSGFDHEPRNLALLAISTILIVAIIFLLRALDRATQRLPRLAMLVTIALCELALVPMFFRAWPLLHLMLVLYLLRNDRRSPLLPWAVIALAATARIPLASSPAFYGFALILPTFVTASAVLLCELPRRGVYGRTTRLAWLPLFFAMMLLGISQQLAVYRAPMFAVHTPRGDYREPNRDRAFAVQQLIGIARQSRARSLVVFPEGLSLNYLTSVPTPLSHYIFTPVESASPAAEELVIRELDARPPDLVAVTARDVREYGFRSFGLDYDTRLMSVVREHYRPLWSLRRPGFAAVLLGRTAAQAR